ncbi:MAG: hypothetical protein ABIR29_00330 [Chthoniobacterales bacterium]
MDLTAANAFVMVVSENYSQYPVETQRTLLEGIYQLADECQENLGEIPGDEANMHLHAMLTLLKSLTNDAFKTGNFGEGFRYARQCFWPIAAPNFEIQELH